MKQLVGDEFADLRARLARHLGVEASEVAAYQEAVLAELAELLAAEGRDAKRGAHHPPSVPVVTVAVAARPPPPPHSPPPPP